MDGALFINVTRGFVTLGTTKQEQSCNFQENRISKYRNKKVEKATYNSIKLQTIALKFRIVAIHYVSVLLVTSTITLK